jgi:XTP/dITP diphosphohydrolase
MRILLASSNPHKLDEIRAVFATQGPLPVELVGLDDIDQDIDEPIEDQPTFEGNALLKARYYAEASGLPCLADDSGLEVDALDGEPGVRSARYAGVQGPRSVVDPVNNRLLLERLGDTPAERRTARFVCAMALVFPDTGNSKPDKGAATVRGTIEGRIIMPAQAADPARPHLGRGMNGFGYDPLFFVPPLGRTTAELSPDQKNAISHRGQASRLMWDKLHALLVGSSDAPGERC